MQLTQTELARLCEIRHWLHAHPELSRHEYETARYVKSVLQAEAAPDRFVDLEGAGFAAIYESGAPGKTVLLRCELDALPIHESNSDLSHISTNPSVGHKCGHDGHMAIMIGVGFALAKQRSQTGRVVLLFQPDEETGTGAIGCLSHSNFAQITPDYAFALHNLPGFPWGQILCKPGSFASAVHFEVIRFTGRAAHSSQPHTGASPAKAIAELIFAADQLALDVAPDEGYALVVPIHTQMGVASSGVAPSYGELSLTLRSDDDRIIAQMLKTIHTRAADLAAQYGLEYEFETLEKFAATKNQAVAVEIIQQTANDLMTSFVPTTEAFRWGEDFGAVTGMCEGAMFGLGAGDTTPPLHDQHYDFPNVLIEDGVRMLLGIVGRVV
ncbi:amidohydrolase [uncultured Ruegeria sp.]|uniref:amidohydrolase n=1 Tax=uncultured Ruegeria sp. TaxID=259304 RepID=UPI00261C6FC0|nr:amidohydrolase [uncultured Ruegeria sp.]